jgi:hypothetical protein
LKHYVDICNLVDGDVSAEVNALDYDGMIKEGSADLQIRFCKIANDQRGCYGC